MRIAIKATHITSGGGLIHLNKIIEWFARLAPDVQFNLLGKTGQDKLFIQKPANFDYRYYYFPARGLAAQLWWERFRLPAILRELSCDLLFEPGNYGTMSAPCPKITLIHNLAPFDSNTIRCESLYQKARLISLRKATIDSMRTSQGIIFLSEYCRNHLIRYLDGTKVLTTVIPHGRPEDNLSADDPSVLKKYGIEGDYILSVSHIYRYKKIKEMVQSYILASERRHDLPPLIIAGTDYDPSYTNGLKTIIKDHHAQDSVHFIGSVDADDLQSLYKNCQFFIFSSVLESISVTLIEAMTYGCAIACSDKGVMPEVTDGAALYFDPDKVEVLAGQIIDLVENEKLRHSLSEKAKKRAKFFSWERTAGDSLRFFNRVLGSDIISVKDDKKKRHTEYVMQ
jgi:glycosyltransferase involved in cell wall biosynthesis